MSRSKKCYRRGKNWSSCNGSYRNGNGRYIDNPQTYFRSVGSNRFGYNACYKNGNGEKISNPKGYFKAVGDDRYGFNK